MPANYVLLEKITVGATGAASVTFNNIPQTGYTDLKIVTSTRTTGASEDVSLFSFNGSSTGFAAKYLQGNGSSASSGTFARWAGNHNASNDTANAFGSAEIYIPNYTSSNYKSYSVDNTTETNGTTAYPGMVAGLWSNTAAITSITITAGSGSYVQYCTFSLYGLAAVGATPAIDPKATGGDIIQTDGTYWYHAFLSSGTFVPKPNLTCDVLVVAGGGGGGGYAYGGGGGAGGLLGYTAQALTSNTSYTVTVGAGGTGGPASTTVTATNGSNSSFGSLTAAVGGGRGGQFGSYSNGATGGSGGGGAGNGTAVGASGTSGQGNAGGNGYTSAPYRGGGGGGATNAGTSAGTATVPVGGAGTSSYSSWGAATNTGQNSGGTYYFAGGGGGGGDSAGGSGGLGGGGTGGTTVASAATAGTPNTGGGGGGSDYAYTNVGAAGGSGIVIVRYTVA